jgi:ketosteroid isomerase-like protein
MKPIAIAAAAALSLLSPAAMAEPGAAATAAAVRAADLAFEKRAQAVGAAQAFREPMDATDGLQFGASPPTRGAEAIFAVMGGAAPATSRLEWTPLDAWGAKSGDLGVTTGTWKFTALAGGRPAVTGRYVTVWRKNAKGEWKGLIDIGNPDPKP